MIIRPIVSAKDTNTAPISILVDKSTPCRGPTSRLAKWGAIRPTKLILPLTATHEAARATAAASSLRRSFLLKHQGHRLYHH